MFFGRKKARHTVAEIDRKDMYPIIRASICNGEQVAGFKSRRDGHFVEIGLIRNDADLQEFMKDYHLTRSEIIKEY